jgi:hypothetical protein
MHWQSTIGDVNQLERHIYLFVKYGEKANEKYYKNPIFHTWSIG